jgi:hypothetical protein
MKEFWKKNKKKIIIGAGAITGLVLVGVGVIFGKKAPKIPITGGVQNILPEFQFELDTIEEAVAKFVELGDKAPVGTVALWNKGVDGAKYIVQDLT